MTLRLKKYLERFLIKRKKAPTSATGAPSDYQKYYLVFCKASHELSKWLHEDYGHVYIMEKLEYLWLVHDPTRNNVMTYFPCEAEIDLVKSLCGNSDKISSVIELNVIKQDGLRMMSFYPLSCVTYTSYHCGIKPPWYVFTPKQLHDWVLKQTDNGFKARRVSHA